MPIKDFTEKKIRISILNKIKPKIQSGPHDKGYIYLGNKLITKVKIPNAHTRIMHKNKSKYIAFDLKLSDNQFNELINCTLTGPDYYKLLKEIEDII